MVSHGRTTGVPLDSVGAGMMVTRPAPVDELNELTGNSLVLTKTYITPVLLGCCWINRVLNTRRSDGVLRLTVNWTGVPAVGTVTNAPIDLKGTDSPYPGPNAVG